eukprot:6178747-Pleurochrysis_carterae.AAC.1
MPVWPLAPAAGGPLVTPFLVSFGTQSLWVSGFGANVFATVLLAADSESMRRPGIGFEFASHVSSFGVAKDTACGADGETEVAHARIEGELHVEQRRETVAKAADRVRDLFRQYRVWELDRNGQRSVEPLNGVNERVEG